LENSYKNFFRRIKSKETPGFPKFRSCKNFFGICYPQSGFSIQDNIFQTKVYGKIQFIKHRELKGEIKQVSISCKNNQFYLNITINYDKLKSGKSKIGIDIGLKTLIVGVDENGKIIEKIENKRDAKYFDKQIAYLQSKRSNLTKRSREYKFLSKVIKRLYDAKIRKINDYQHKVSKRLGSKYDTIFAEDLSVKHMSEGNYTNLNKSIRNAKLAQLISFLEYKTNKIVLVNPKNTSKTCHYCGKIHNIKLSDRTITCSCGKTYDRDENAARNVYCLGQAILDNPGYVGAMGLQEALTFR
jgi:putative transposase